MTEGVFSPSACQELRHGKKHATLPFSRVADPPCSQSQETLPPSQAAYNSRVSTVTSAPTMKNGVTEKPLLLNVLPTLPTASHCFCFSAVSRCHHEQRQNRSKSGTICTDVMSEDPSQSIRTNRHSCQNTIIKFSGAAERRVGAATESGHAVIHASLSNVFIEGSNGASDQVSGELLSRAHTLH
jgi:hypothetical protein